MRVLDLGLWEAFVWVAREHSFSRAAAKLRLGVPQLSKRLARLEEELGVRLFNRTTRSVNLTSEGELLLPAAESLLSDAQELESQFETRGAITGEIRLTCLPSLGHRFLAPILAEFTQLHPQVQFDIDLTDHLLNLTEARRDLALRVQTPRASNVVVSKLFANELVLCAAPSYLKGRKHRLKTPQDLADHKVLCLEAHARTTFRGSSTRLCDIIQPVGLRCESALFLTELALQGFAIVLRARWDVAPFLKSGRLIEILPSFPVEPFGDVVIAMPSRRFVSRRVRAFVDFIVEKSEQLKTGL